MVTVMLTYQQSLVLSIQFYMSNGIRLYTTYTRRCNRNYLISSSERDRLSKVLHPIPQNVSLKGMNEYQVLGSAITYIRRYALSSLLGIVTDKDTDAATPKQVRKPVLNAATPAFEKALKFVREGGSISAIESKYSLGTEVKALLKL